MLKCLHVVAPSRLINQNVTPLSTTLPNAEPYPLLLNASFTTPSASFSQPLHSRPPIRPAVLPFPKTLLQIKEEPRGEEEKEQFRKRWSEQKRSPETSFQVEPSVRLQILLFGVRPFRWAHQLPRIAQVLPLWAGPDRPEMDRCFRSGSGWTGPGEGRGGAEPDSRRTA